MSVSPVMSMSSPMTLVSMTRLGICPIPRIAQGLATPMALELLSHNRPRAICWIKKVWIVEGGMVHFQRRIFRNLKATYRISLDSKIFFLDSVNKLQLTLQQ